MLRNLLLASALLVSTCASWTHAASFESLISPGPLSTPHAEYEDECESCHAVFDSGQQRALCLDCHEDIAEDLSLARNFHGLNPEIADQPCSSCHVEHEGRDFDISGLVVDTFDHALTEFELVGAHAEASCQSCHQEDVLYRDTESDCIACHKEDDTHAGGLGEDCATCHAATAWDSVSFDHFETTEFKLVGAHAEQPCASCHIDEKYENTPTLCVDCHSIDDVHKGARGSDCERCHSSTDWQTSEFDHFAETEFKLVGQHAELACSSCHLLNMEIEQPPTSCVGCHSSDDIHAGGRGEDCGSCHKSTTWKIEFDHFAETGFALAGSHQSLRCESCHGNDISAELPDNCEGCHQDDDPHDGTLGACDSCHSDTSWYEQIRFDHEFTNFPLVGLHKLATCDQCHESQRFELAPELCIDCHEEDDNHRGKFGTACDTCHNSGGWDLWQFNHDQQTSFTLAGAHADLTCISCHTEHSPPPEDLGTDCIDCHLVDDRHNGQFGKSCDRCHTTDSFADDVRFR